ncbi:hypothetical protein [Streptomyces sp. NBC_00316]|uniref:hypothetical protein n=1 Tax=Streptomyces sp. NBC_00316 TaxID=2975710 RepID=UPI002E2C618C|nr:hypothetical protein [Streptomyces sp. NBC_00316]
MPTGTLGEAVKEAVHRPRGTHAQHVGAPGVLVHHFQNKLDLLPAIGGGQERMPLLVLDGHPYPGPALVVPKIEDRPLCAVPGVRLTPLLRRHHYRP